MATATSMLLISLFRHQMWPVLLPACSLAFLVFSKSLDAEKNMQRAIADELDEQDQWLVKLAVMVNGVQTAHDAGSLYLDGSMLCFKGIRGDFALPNNLPALQVKHDRIEFSQADGDLVIVFTGLPNSLKAPNSPLAIWLEREEPSSETHFPPSQIQPEFTSRSLKIKGSWYGLVLCLSYPILMTVFHPPKLVGEKIGAALLLAVFLTLAAFGIRQLLKLRRLEGQLRNP